MECLGVIRIADEAVEKADAPFYMQATKLANVLFTYELQRRLGQHGIQVGSRLTANFLAAADRGMVCVWKSQL